MASVISSPCAKFTTRTTPKITLSPSAIRPYTSPVSTPESTTFNISSTGMGTSCPPQLARRSGFVTGHRKYGLGLRGGGGQPPRRHLVQILDAGRADPLHLALGVELNGRPEHHLARNVGLANRLGQHLGVHALGALEGIGRDQHGLEGKPDVQAVKDQAVLWVLTQKGLFYPTGELCLR